jgi:hypothetical protein
MFHVQYWTLEVVSRARRGKPDLLAVALCFSICAWKASFTGAWQRGSIKAGILGVYIVVTAPLAVTGVSTLGEAEELNHTSADRGPVNLQFTPHPTALDTITVSPTPLHYTQSPFPLYSIVTTEMAFFHTMTLPQFLGMSDYLLHGFQATSAIWLHSLPEDFALRTQYNKDADRTAQDFQEKMTTGTLTIQNAAREASIARNKEVIDFRKDTSALALLYVTWKKPVLKDFECFSALYAARLFQKDFEDLDKEQRQQVRAPPLSSVPPWPAAHLSSRSSTK